MLVTLANSSALGINTSLVFFFKLTSSYLASCITDDDQSTKEWSISALLALTTQKKVHIQTAAASDQLSCAGPATLPEALPFTQPVRPLCTVLVVLNPDG